MPVIRQREDPPQPAPAAIGTKAAFDEDAAMTDAQQGMINSDG